MAYSFEQVFAADPSNPANVARNAAVTIFAPGDIAQTPLTLTTPNGDPLANPLQVNNNGFGSAFMHATLDRVAWSGGNFTGFFTSYEGMKAEAVSARTAAQTAAANAGSAAAADVAARIAAGEFVGAPGADGSNVLPTDTAIKNAITTPGTETATALSATYASGYVHFVVSETAPTETEIDSKPVVWINTSEVALTEVTATAPTFTDLSGTGSDTYTIPTKAGVVYKVAGVTKAAGTYAGTGTVTVTAEAASGYTLTGTASWSNTFSSVADPVWTTLATDNFTGTDGSINGRTTTTGALTWVAPVSNSLFANAGTGTALITSNAIKSTTAQISHTAQLTVANQNVRVSVDYDLNTGASVSRQVRVFVRGGTIPANSTVIAYINQAGTLAVNNAAGSIAFTGATTGYPKTGNLALEMIGNAFRVLLNNAEVATGTSAGNGTLVGFAAYENECSIDNFKVEVYA